MQLMETGRRMVVARDRGTGETGWGGGVAQRIQAFGSKRNKFCGSNVRHGD